MNPVVPSVRRSSTLHNTQPRSVAPPSRVDVSGPWPVIDGDFEFDDIHFLREERWNSLSASDRRKIQKWLEGAGRILRPHELGVIHTRKPHALTPSESGPMSTDLWFNTDAVRHNEDINIAVMNCGSFEEAVQKFREWLEDVQACGLAKE